MSAIIWRRLDVAGTDAARILRDGAGWRIEGKAVFADPGGPAALDYAVACDADWRSVSGEVSGWIGARSVALTLRRDGEGWIAQGCPQAEDLSGPGDIDLGFTPATNTNAIRRLGLAPGAEGATEALWLDVEGWRLRRLPQVYRRLDAGRYRYISPVSGFEAVLAVDAEGWVTGYPGLWTSA